MRPSSDRAWDDAPGPLDENPPRRRRRSHKPHPGSARKGLSRRRLRLVYFTLASLWGFLAGSAAILWGLSVREYPLAVDSSLTLLLGAAAVVAVAGGVIAASAYRDAAHRR